MTLEKRIGELERRRALEPELACGLTDSGAYLAIIHRPDLTFEEDPAKPGFYRLIKRPRPKHGVERRLERRFKRPITPQEAYDIMIGKLDPQTLYAKGDDHAPHLSDRR